MGSGFAAITPSDNSTRAWHARDGNLAERSMVCGEMTILLTMILSIGSYAVPKIADLAAMPNSPNSILLVWTTDVQASFCGVVAGSPYSYASPTVDPVKTGGDDCGATAHSLAAGTALESTRSLSDVADGTQPFFGTLGELPIYSRGLSDLELNTEVAQCARIS
jgi:hypothetical protein